MNVLDLNFTIKILIVDYSIKFSQKPENFEAEFLSLARIDIDGELTKSHVISIHLRISTAHFLYSMQKKMLAFLSLSFSKLN